MKTRKAIALTAMLAVSGICYAEQHWSAEVGKVTVFETGVTYMIVSNPRGGPSGTFSCAQNVVYLGVKNTTAPKEVTVTQPISELRYWGDADVAYFIGPARWGGAVVP